MACPFSFRPESPNNSVHGGGGFRSTSHLATAVSPSNPPREPAPLLPPIRPSGGASVHARNQPRFTTVTIPRDLKPHEVPLPLRAEEVWGAAPRSRAVTQRRESLFERWMNAYVHGTLAPESPTLASARKADSSGTDDDGVQGLRPSQQSGPPTGSGQLTQVDSSSVSLASRTSCEVNVMHPNVSAPGVASGYDFGDLSGDYGWMNSSSFMLLSSFVLSATPAAAVEPQTPPRLPALCVSAQDHSTARPDMTPFSAVFPFDSQLLDSQLLPNNVATEQLEREYCFGSVFGRSPSFSLPGSSADAFAVLGPFPLNTELSNTDLVWDNYCTRTSFAAACGLPSMADGIVPNEMDDEHSHIRQFVVVNLLPEDPDAYVGPYDVESAWLSGITADRDMSRVSASTPHDGARAVAAASEVVGAASAAVSSKNPSDTRCPVRSQGDGGTAATNGTSGPLSSGLPAAVGPREPRASPLAVTQRRATVEPHLPPVIPASVVPPHSTPQPETSQRPAQPPTELAPIVPPTAVPARTSLSGSCDPRTACRSQSLSTVFSPHHSRFDRGGRSAAALAAERLLTLLVLAPSASKTVVQPTGSNGVQVSLPTARTGAATATALCRVVVDEAVPTAATEPYVDSLLLREVAEEMRDGHGAALLLSVAGGCGGIGGRTIETTLIMVLAAVLQRQAEAAQQQQQQQCAPAQGATEEEEDYYFKMEVSVALIERGRSVKDLVVNRDEEFAAMEPTWPVANPLVGWWCDNVVFQSVRNVSQIRGLLQPVAAWLQKTPESAEEAGETLGIYVALRQANHLTRPADERTLTLSSLLIYVGRSPDGVVSLVHDRESGSPLQRSLLRRVGDGCFTVVATCVGARSGSSDAYASLCAEAKALSNSGLVGGNVGRYVAALRTALAREETAAAGEGGDAQQRQLLRADLLHRMEALMHNPWSGTIPFYPDRVALLEDAAEKTALARAPAAAAAAAAKAAQDDNMISLASSAQSIRSRNCSFRVPTAEEALVMFNDCRIHTVMIRDSTSRCGYELMEGTSNRLVQVANRTSYLVDEVKPRRVLPPLYTQPTTSNTSALCSLFAMGHNTAILSFDGRSDNVFSSPVWCVLAEAIDKVFGRTDGAISDLYISFSLIQANGEAVDLLEPGAKMQPLQVGSSPVCGSRVLNAGTHMLVSPDAMWLMLHQVAAAATPHWAKDTFLYVSLINCFAVDGDVYVSSFGVTVTGSHGAVCRRILATGASNTTAAAAAEGGDDAEWPPLHPEVARLHRGALTGSAATVFLASLNTEEDAAVALEMASVAVPQLKKVAVKSGSVKEFLHRTRKGLERRQKKVRCASEAEWRQLSQMVSQVTEMLDDYAALLESGTTVPLPKWYVNDVVVPPYPRATVPAPAAALDNIPATPVTGARAPSTSSSPARTISIAMPSANHMRTTLAAGAHALTSPPSTSARHNRVTAGTSTGAAAVLALRTAASGSVLSSARASMLDSGSATPDQPPVLQHPQWVVGVEQHSKAAKAMDVARSGHGLTWKSTLEHFETDGVVVYPAGKAQTKQLFTENCAAVRSMLDKSLAGQSCAMLGLMDDHDEAAGASVHVRTQPLWRSYVAVLLNTCFHAEDDAAWLPGSELHLRLCAVQDRTLRYDFLQETPAPASAAPLDARVSLAANPLFGPVVRNTTVKRATNLQECQLILRKGLDALNELHNAYDSDTIVIASAVLKNVTRGDTVVISSVTAFAARIDKDLSAVRDIFAMDPRGRAPPALYHYALRGPCHLLCLTTLRSASGAQCVEALRLGQSVRYGMSLPVPRGTLSTCIREQVALLQRRRASGRASALAARTVASNVVQELMRMQRDRSCSIVVFPVQDDGVPYLLPEASATFGPAQQCVRTTSLSGDLATSGCAVPNGTDSGNGSGNRWQCQCTAVVTAAPRRRSSALEARVESQTVRSGHTTYPFTEVVLRTDNSTLLRPGLLHSIAEHVREGRNATLLAIDGSGSSVGPALLSKVMRLLVESTDVTRVRKTLFVSITAARYPLRTSPGADAEAQVKDLFVASDQFHPLRAARSPFFGSCVDGARFFALNRIDNVYLTLQDAQRACSFNKATMNVLIVLKQVILAADGSVDDVTMSSVLAVLDSAESEQGPHACSVFDAMLDRRAASKSRAGAAVAQPGSVSPTSVKQKAAAALWRRCLLAQALGGDSFTYGVVGLTADAQEEEAAALLRFGTRLMNVPCRPPARSSAREMLQRAQAHLRQHSGRCTDASTRGLSDVPWDWQQVKEEAEQMLRNPDACDPLAYLVE